jgi:hypothetical protein
MSIYLSSADQIITPKWQTPRNTQLACTFRIKQSRYTPWRRLGERRHSSYSFTTSALDGGEWSASCPCRPLPPRKGHPYPLYRRLGGPQSRLNTEATGKIFPPLPGIEPRSPGRPVRSQTLYWLSYPGYSVWCVYPISLLTAPWRQVPFTYLCVV